MSTKAKRRRMTGRTVFVRALSVFLALLIVGGALAALLDIV